MTTALIIVDVQNDFIDGSLAVPGGEEAAKAIGNYLKGPLSYDYIVTTQDWHIDPENHFSEAPDFKDTWPVHCVAGTAGANLSGELDTGYDEQFLKGHYSAAYSGFEGVGDSTGDSLVRWLRDRHVTQVDICGIATDYCVKATVLDAVKEGFKTRLLTDFVAAVTPETGAEAIFEMVDARVDMVANGMS